MYSQNPNDFSSCLSWRNISPGIIGYFDTNDGISYATDNSGILFVDVNGDKGPNKVGRDIFVFRVNWDKNKIEPDGLSSYQTDCTTANVNSGRWLGSCTAKVLIEGKMDY